MSKSKTRTLFACLYARNLDIITLVFTSRLLDVT